MVKRKKKYKLPKEAIQDLKPLSAEQRVEGSFYAALVDQQDLLAVQCCPHCDQEVHPSEFTHIVSFDNDDDEVTHQTTQNIVIGDAVSCPFCGQVVLSVMYPILDLPEPVFLDWTIFQEAIGENPSGEPSFGIAAKDT